MAVYKANANGVTHKDLIIGGQKHKAVYAGDKLIWEKGGQTEFIFEWEDVLAIQVKGDGVLYSGTGETYQISGGTWQHIILEKEGEYTSKLNGDIIISRFAASVGNKNTYCGVTKVLTPFPPSMSKWDNTSFMFYQCKKLTYVPRNLLKNMTGLKEAIYMFCDAIRFDAVGDGFFDNNIKLMDVSSCFSNSGMTSIPPGIFRKNVNIVKFDRCFASSKITFIPEGLFENNINAQSFYGCFMSCGKLELLPHRLFAGLNKVTTFESCFWDVLESATTPASRVKNLPTDIFKGCTGALSFKNCFWNFNTPEVGAGLFDDCINATDFEGCFSACKRISKIAPTLFDKCVKANNFTECFMTQYKFGTVTPDTKLTQAPKLWEKFPSAKGTKCYAYQKRLSFYYDIPTSWR